MADVPDALAEVGTVGHPSLAEFSLLLEDDFRAFLDDITEALDAESIREHSRRNGSTSCASARGRRQLGRKGSREGADVSLFFVPPFPLSPESAPSTGTVAFIVRYACACALESQECEPVIHLWRVRSRTFTPATIPSSNHRALQTTRTLRPSGLTLPPCASSMHVDFGGPHACPSTIDPAPVCVIDEACLGTRCERTPSRGPFLRTTANYRRPAALPEPGFAHR